MPQSAFELKRKVLQLAALHDVGRALNTLRPEAELLEETMNRAVATLDATGGFVFSFDEQLNVQHFFSIGLSGGVSPEAVVRDHGGDREQREEREAG